MAFLRASLVAICAATATVLAAPTIYAIHPIVTIDKGKFIGTTADGVNKFLGIPFAKPPSVVDIGSTLCPLGLTHRIGLHRQSWRPALPSASGAWSLLWYTQFNWVRSFVSPTSNYAGDSERVTP